MESESQRIVEWDTNINKHLQRGDLHGAIGYVNSLDLSPNRRQEICNKVQASVRRQEEQRRQAETWILELNRLLSERKRKEARKYVASLPIEKQIKEKILAQLPKTSWFLS